MTDWEDRFWRKVERGPERSCWIWMAASSPKGYGVFYDPSLRRTRHAHRAAWFLFYGEYPPSKVCHTCDNRLCVNPSHLFLGSRLDNRGRHGRTVLTPEKVRTIRRLRRQGLLLKDIGKEVGVSIPAVHAVLSGRTWSHVIG